MSKGLEDLQWLVKNGYISMKSYQEDVIMLDCIDNIEKELKELEEYKKCIDLKEAQFISTHDMSVIDTETFNQLVKNNQALELIKAKEVDLFNIKYTASLEMYNCRMKTSGFAYAHRLLTKEEYEYLKEVLCYEIN